jgi:hypothetical protein
MPTTTALGAGRAPLSSPRSPGHQGLATAGRDLLGPTSGALVDLRGRAPGVEHAHLGACDEADATFGWRGCWWRSSGAIVRVSRLTGAAGGSLRVVVAEPDPPVTGDGLTELTERLDLALVRLDRDAAALPDVVEELVRIPVAGSVRGRLGCLVVLDLGPDGRVDASARCAPGPLRLAADSTVEAVCPPFGSAAVTLAPHEALVVTTPSALDGADVETAAAAPAAGHGPGTGPCELLDRLTSGGIGPGMPRVGGLTGGADGAAATGAAVLAIMRA